MSAATKLLKGLVSKTDEALNAIKREKGTGAEFLRELEKTPGVKPAEIKDRRLDKVLPAMGKTTKAEVQRVLKENPPPTILESVLGGRESWRQELDLLENRGRINLSQRERERYDELMDRRRREGLPADDSPAKFQDYTIPGGENYREILLRLPPKGTNEAEARAIVGDRVWDRMTPEQRREFMSYPTDAAKKESYRSSHWEEPNVLAHARVSDRTGPNGEKILHIEEIQSDWHQAGRKQGYRTPEKQAEIEALQKQKLKAKSELNEIERRYNDAKEASKSFDAKIASPEFASLPAERQAQMREAAQSWGKAWMDALPKLMKAREAYESIPDAARVAGDMVPDAPFKKNWHELTMKRLLNYAAENNYDRVAITPGMEQAKRYGIGNHVDEIVVTGRTDALTGEKSKSVALDTKDGRSIRLGVSLDGTVDNVSGASYSGLKGKKLDEVIGKELAQKVMSGDSQIIAGEGLMVGGEGMKGFYDKILPDYLNSLGRPYGASVGRMEIPKPPANSMDVSGFPLGEEYIQGRATWSEFLAANPDAASKFSTPLHTFDITPQMRQEITSKGLPLYSAAPVAATGTGAAVLSAADDQQEKAPVYISDNPDTMRLELEDKQMAGGGLAKALKEAVKAGKKMTPAEEAAMARGMGVPGVDFADPLAPPSMRMSEALGITGSEGKYLQLTEADRSRVFGPNRGGVGFSALQLYSEPHKKANTVWGFGNEITAKKKIAQSDPDKTVWTTYVGSPEQHKSNTVVVKDAIKNLQEANRTGNLHPEQVRLINERIRQTTNDKGNKLFPEGFDITDPQALNMATTFERRSAISDALMGIGVKKPMISREFKQKFPGVAYSDAARVQDILARETDPSLIGAQTFDVGPHLFTMDKNIINRPDLNEAFPYQVTGTDLGVKYQLAPLRLAVPDWAAVNAPADEAINAWRMSRGLPRQFVDEKYLTNLQKAGYKKGGLAS